MNKILKSKISLHVIECERFELELQQRPVDHADSVPMPSGKSLGCNICIPGVALNMHQAYRRTLPTNMSVGRESCMLFWGVSPGIWNLRLNLPACSSFDRVELNSDRS